MVFPRGGAVSCASLRFGVGSLAEIGAEGVMVGEADVVGRRHHHPGDGAAFEAAHAVAEHGLRHAAQGLETGGQGGQGGLGALVVGEAHEADPAPGQHGAEHRQRPDLAPVDDQHVPRRPHPRPPAPVVVGAPCPLGLGHQAAEVAGRAGVARGPGRRQHALGRYESVRLRHRLGHDVGDGVVVMGHGRRRAGGFRFGGGNGPPHGLGGGAAELGCGR